MSDRPTDMLKNSLKDLKRKTKLCTHHAAHWWKVPDATHNGPTAHHVQQVVHHPKLAAVPERITKTRVILPK